MYEDFYLIFTVGEAEERIPYTIGVHQGDNLAPLLFLLFFQAAIDSLKKEWEKEQIKCPEFKRFPDTQKGVPRGRLRGQGKANGKIFDFWKSLYADDGAFLFETRNDLEKGAKLIYTHFRRFGLQMHIGENGKESKTEAVVFTAAGIPYDDYDTSPVPVGPGYITYTRQFKYLGSIVSHDLSDTHDVENRILQEQKALNALMSNVFRNSHLSLHVKKLLYMAIPINLLLWGCKSWALKQSDQDKIQRFHSKGIRRILNINMIEVRDQQITNQQIYTKFNIDPIENIMVSRQLRWLGKIANMPDTRIPRKFLNAWHEASRPVGRLQQTLRHTYIHALQLAKFIPEDDH